MSPSCVLDLHAYTSAVVLATTCLLALIRVSSCPWPCMTSLAPLTRWWVAISTSFACKTRHLDTYSWHQKFIHNNADQNLGNSTRNQKITLADIFLHLCYEKTTINASYLIVLTFFITDINFDRNWQRYFFPTESMDVMLFWFFSPLTRVPQTIVHLCGTSPSSSCCSAETKYRSFPRNEPYFEREVRFKRNTCQLNILTAPFHSRCSEHILTGDKEEKEKHLWNRVHHAQLIENLLCNKTAIEQFAGAVRTFFVGAMNKLNYSPMNLIPMIMCKCFVGIDNK